MVTAVGSREFWETSILSHNYGYSSSPVSSSETICHLRSIFTRHGIPDELWMDNGSQFTSQEFQKFVQTNKIRYFTSSPLFPRGNGMAECAFQTVKHVIRSATNPYAALLAYKTTPLENRFSPAQILFGHQLKTIVPIWLQNGITVK